VAGEALMNPELADPSSKLILIVDDDDGVCDLVEFIIRREGFRADKASDGEEALTKIAQERPDLVLLDLLLPKYGGFEVLRKLQLGEHAGIPIVVISGRFADKGTIDMIRQESNVVEFLEKPLRAQQILSVVHRVLGTRPSQPAGGPRS